MFENLHHIYLPPYKTIKIIVEILQNHDILVSMQIIMFYLLHRN